MGEQVGSGETQSADMGTTGNTGHRYNQHGYQGYGSELDAPTLPDVMVSPPATYPNHPTYPNGRPPQWPGPRAPRPMPQEPHLTRPMDARHTIVQASYPRHASPAPPQPPYHASRYQPQPAYRAHRSSLPQLPMAHILLILGVAAMGMALLQPWGVDAQGSPVYVKSFTSAAMSAQGVDVGALAYQTAEYILGAVTILAAALIVTNFITLVLNKAIGLIGLSGCASLIFFPVLWALAALLTVALLLAAGFGGLGYLSELPFVRHHGFADVTVQSAASGYYTWWAGIGLTFIGMLGQLVLRRR